MSFTWTDTRKNAVKTSDVIRRFGTFKAGKNVLLIHGCENYRYLSFAEMLTKRMSCQIFYCFLPDLYPDTALIPKLLYLMSDNEIGTLLIDAHVPRTNFVRGFNIFEILNESGVKSFMIDNDFFDMAPNIPFMRLALNDVVCRFSTWEILNRYWDRIFENKNVLYVPLLQDYSEQEFRDRGKKIIICTHLRSDLNKYDLGETLIKYFGVDNFIQKAWSWYLENRQKTIEMDIPFAEKVRRITANSFVSLNAATDFYKTIIAGWVRDKANLEIYGDRGWGDFHPDNYKGWLSEQEYVGKLNEPNIFLVPNLSATYLSAFGPLFDMVRWGKKFLHPKVIEGNIPSFEFSCADELNDKLAIISKQEPDMAKLKQDYQLLVNLAIERIIDESD